VQIKKLNSPLILILIAIGLVILVVIFATMNGSNNLFGSAANQELIESQIQTAQAFQTAQALQTQWAQETALQEAIQKTANAEPSTTPTPLPENTSEPTLMATPTERIHLEICHYLAGNGTYSQITIAAEILAAHQAHGDLYPVPEGGCPKPVPTNTPIPSNTPIPTNTPTNTPVPTITPRPTVVLANIVVSSTCSGTLIKTPKFTISNTGASMTALGSWTIKTSLGSKSGTFTLGAGQSTTITGSIGGTNTMTVTSVPNGPVTATRSC
jgi:hypothetical protein